MSATTRKAATARPVDESGSTAARSAKPSHATTKPRRTRRACPSGNRCGTRPEDPAERGAEQGDVLEVETEQAARDR